MAPKQRARLPYNDRTSRRSIASTSRHSAGARSTLGGSRQRSQREAATPNAVFLRAVDKCACTDFFDMDEESSNLDDGLAIWVDQDVLTTKALRGLEWVCVSLVKPAGLQGLLDPQQQQRKKEVDASDAGKPASRIVAKLMAWEDAPDSRHAALSSVLCSALEAEGIVGGLVRLEAAPQPVSKHDIETLKIFPFLADNKDKEALKIGGHSKAMFDDGAEKIKVILGKSRRNSGLLDGPLTNGLILPGDVNSKDVGSWRGGILRWPVEGSKDPSRKSSVTWCLGSNVKLKIEMQTDIPSPLNLSSISPPGVEPIPKDPPSLIGIDGLVHQLTSHLSHCSSVLLTGGLGSGKTALAYLLAHRLRSEFLYNTTYFPCHKLVTDETRISTIKDTFTRLFMSASWGTRPGGRALVILDDLDKLCPTETELQTSENGRSRQVSELLCSLVREYCGIDSGVVLMATAQGKEAVNNVMIGGNIFKEIVALKAPDKDGRRHVLQALTGQSNGHIVNNSNGHVWNDSNDDEAAWLGGSPALGSTDLPERFVVDRNLDFLDLAGQTDGYMPGDLMLLVSRAKNEALIRSLGTDTSEESGITLTKRDFQDALKGFTPASLRNVTLQSSKTTFKSIGGLHETRKILLETLQYPTAYAPIFAQCPLRLRSGLLLYGYPGCGKTLLASAVAGECGLNFISVKGPEILNKYIGASEKSVRDLFDRAESAKPCVLFFDEFDSIAPKRGHDSTGVTDRVVNQLLTQMDGAEGLSGVYVLAATSRPDLIDPALLRPGRLDKSILCDMPSTDDRLDILRALGEKLMISPGVLDNADPRRSLYEVAHRTAGYSGADLQAVIYNAHLEAIHDILGDHGVIGESTGKSRQDTKQNNHTSRRDILQFRFSKEADADTSASGVNRAKEAENYAAIIAKLDAIRSAKRKEKNARRGIPDQSAKGQLNGEGPTGDTAEKVVIEWKHIEASLATTRSSIGADERRRLERIYREFVVGRNGEMPSGQGSTDVGGRSSLM